MHVSVNVYSRQCNQYIILNTGIRGERLAVNRLSYGMTKET
jgi:hypothetical protein